MSFDPTHWYWLGWLVVGFLPLELWGALKTPARADTFSEFVWYAFGVKPRRVRVPTPGIPGSTHVELRRPADAPLRRFYLVAFLGSLTMHLAFGWSVTPVVVFGIAVAAVLIRAVGWERGR